KEKKRSHSTKKRNYSIQCISLRWANFPRTNHQSEYDGDDCRNETRLPFKRDDSPECGPESSSALLRKIRGKCDLRVDRWPFFQRIYGRFNCSSRSCTTPYIV